MQVYFEFREKITAGDDKGDLGLVDAMDNGLLSQSSIQSDHYREK